MLVLKQSTAVDVLIGPFLDDTDASTAETGETPAVKLSKNGQALATKNDVTTPVHDADGYYNCELDATDTNTVGTIVLSVAATAAALPVRHELQVVETAVYEAMYADTAPGFATVAALTTAQADLDIITGADGVNLLSASQATLDVIDGVDGLVAISAQIDGIGAASGGALNFEATSDNLTVAIKTVDNVGTPTGVFGATQAEDGSVMSIAHDTNDIDHIFGYTIGGARTAVGVVFAGYLNSGNDAMLIQAYDFVGSDWETIALLPGKSGSTNDTISAALLSKHTGTGADLGNVYIRFEADGAMSSPTLVIDKLLVEVVNIGQSVGYANGMIWFDSDNANTDTEPHVDGTADNPVSTVAALQTLETTVGLHDFHVSSNSTFAPAGDLTGVNIFGIGYTLTLGGHDYSGTHVYHASPVTGIALSGGADHFDVLDSIIGAVTVNDSHFTNCSFTDTLTLGGVASNVRIINSRSVVAGASTPIVDFGTASTNHNVTIADWQNGLEIRNFNATTGGGTDLLSVSGTGQLVIASTCDGGTINLRGQWRVTDNSGGAVTITRDDVASDIIAALADTNELQGDWANGGRLDLILDIIAADTTTDIPALIAALENLSAAQVNAEVDTAISDAALATAANLATVDAVVDNLNLGIIYGAAATGTLSTTEATTGLTGYADDQLIGRVIVFTSGAADGEATDITDYVSTGGHLTFTALTTAPGNADTFKIV